MTNPDLVLAVCARLAAQEATGLENEAHAVARRMLPLADPSEQEALARAAVAHMQGLGPLEALLAEPSVNEVMVNNGGEVWVERAGTVERAGRLAADVVPRLIERILNPLGRRLDRLAPIVDARLPDGSRVCAVIPPIAIDGPCLSLRRFGVQRRSLADFGAADVAAVLVDIVRSRCNVLISGATSSGKTTLLNALAAHIAPGERIITLEDTAELRLVAAHVLRLESRPATVDGVPAITMTDLVRTSLRLRPDRLVVGEVRGAEVVDMLQALNTGHDGSLTTCHANNPIDAVRRITALVHQHAPGWPLAAVDDHVRSSIDVIVHVARGAEGRRRVDEIVELAPSGTGEDHHPVVRNGDVVGGLRRRRVCA